MTDANCQRLHTHCGVHTKTTLPSPGLRAMTDHSRKNRTGLFQEGENDIQH